MQMIQVERLLQPCNPEGLGDVMMHGTYSYLIPAIRTGGLKAGGRSDPDDPRGRAHIHMVASVESTGDLAGVRQRADACLEVRIRAWLERSGTTAYWSQNGVLLVPGVIPPSFLGRAFNRFTGDPIGRQPTRPVLQEDGAPFGATVVMRYRTTTDQAEQLLQRESASRSRGWRSVIFDW